MFSAETEVCGLILTLYKAKHENVKAMLEFTKEYGST
jgi:hypothetical protein